ncbi:MAG: hypothetical protein ACLSVD_19360 [Eggerthellaceae bacterium]
MRNARRDANSAIERAVMKTAFRGRRARGQAEVQAHRQVHRRSRRGVQEEGSEVMEI